MRAPGLTCRGSLEAALRTWLLLSEQGALRGWGWGVGWCGCREVLTCDPLGGVLRRYPRTGGVRKWTDPLQELE